MFSSHLSIFPKHTEYHPIDEKPSPPIPRQKSEIRCLAGDHTKYYCSLRQFLLQPGFLAVASVFLFCPTFALYLALTYGEGHVRTALTFCGEPTYFFIITTVRTGIIGPDFRTLEFPLLVWSDYFFFFFFLKLGLRRSLFAVRSPPYPREGISNVLA